MAMQARKLPASLIFCLFAATVLAAWLRTHNLAAQVVLDDEWHALHKLATASYANIFQSFGLADHSIPLTLFYKAMADTIGLTEGRLRALQAACGIALVPLCGWLAWRAMRDAPAAVLVAVLICGAPYLVFWSRFARPYSITVLLTVACIASVWSWRSRRTLFLATLAVTTGALAAWFHTVAGMYGAIACLFVFAEDLFFPVSKDRTSHGWRLSLYLGTAMAAGMALLLAPPWMEDRQSLFGKAGIDHPGLDSLIRLIAIVWGGVPAMIMAIASLCAAWGIFVVLRYQRRLGIYLLLLGAVPGATLAIIGASWISAGQNFLRYQLPLLPLLLFFAGVGAISIVRTLSGARAEPMAWLATLGLSIAYLVATPAIAQVDRLGTWYGHINYHWDYRYRWMSYEHADKTFDPPQFYRELGRLPPGTLTIVEAPFEWEAPLEQLAYYATFHRQHELFGMLHDLCLKGDRVGEVPNDPRFRFRLFVFLDDPRSVRASGARYLVLHLMMPHGKPFPEAATCLAKIQALYGKPMELDDRLAVFDLEAH
jgi:hypothetical protein